MRLREFIAAPTQVNRVRWIGVPDTSSLTPERFTTLPTGSLDDK